MSEESDFTPKYYTIYLAKNDEIVAFGDRKACAAMLGVSEKSLYSIVSGARNGRNKKYEVYSEPLDPVEAGILTEEEYEAMLREEPEEEEEEST